MDFIFYEQLFTESIPRPYGILHVSINLLTNLLEIRLT